MRACDPSVERPSGPQPPGFCAAMHHPRKPGASLAASLSLHACGLAALLWMTPAAVLRSVVWAPREVALVAPPAPLPAAPRRPAPMAPPRLPPVPVHARLLVPPPSAVPRPAAPVLAAPVLAVPMLKEPPQPMRAPAAAPAPPIPTLPPVAAPVPPAPAAVFAGVPAPPPMSVPRQTRRAGFDLQARSLALPVTPDGRRVAASGFEQAAPGDTAARGRTVQTGAFEQAAVLPGAPRGMTGRSAAAGFDRPAEAPAAPRRGPTVRKTAFDEAPAAGAPAARPAAPPPGRLSPVEILDKPKPAYTEAARRRRISGTVLLDVIFTAAGQVRVLGVVRGLGYGLDEAAAEAARGIRFRPALQDGAPVAQRAALHVVFEMTE